MPIFVTKDGQTFGPYEPGEIAIFLGTGDFQPEDFCWQEGWTEWRAISSVLPSKPLPSAPSAAASAPPLSTPPLPGQIPNDIEIIGTLKLPGDRTVACRVEGEIICPSTVTIALEAKVKARIKAGAVIIYGAVEGDIHATNRAVLKSSSTLIGDIHATRVLVEEGATFSGKSHVNSKAPAKTRPSPASSRKSAAQTHSRRS